MFGLAKAIAGIASFYLIFVSSSENATTGGFSIDGYSESHTMERGWPQTYWVQVIDGNQCDVEFFPGKLLIAVALFVVLLILLFPKSISFIGLSEWFTCTLAFSVIGLVLISDFILPSVQSTQDLLAVEALNETVSSISYGEGGPLLLRRLGMTSLIDEQYTTRIETIRFEKLGTLEATAECVAKLSQLDRLILDDTECDSSFLNTIGSSRVGCQLSDLSLAGTQIDSDTRFSLFVNLKCLDLSGTQISSQDVNELLKIKTLRKLRCASTDLSFDEISRILSSLSLNYLDVTGCELSAEEISNLRKYGTTIQFEQAKRVNIRSLLDEIDEEILN